MYIVGDAQVFSKHLKNCQTFFVQPRWVAGFQAIDWFICCCSFNDSDVPFFGGSSLWLEWVELFWGCNNRTKSPWYLFVIIYEVCQCCPEIFSLLLTRDQRSIVELNCGFALIQGEVDTFIKIQLHVVFCRFQLSVCQRLACHQRREFLQSLFRGLGSVGAVSWKYSWCAK